MRQWSSVGAATLASIAVVVSVLDDAQEAVAFFVVAGIVAAIQAWLAAEPIAGARRGVSIAIAVAWLIATLWIDVLLLMYQGASRPPPEPEATYLGLTATIYHLVALHGGAVLVTLSASLPRRWAGGSGSVAPRPPVT